MAIKCVIELSPGVYQAREWRSFAHPERFSTKNIAKAFVFTTKKRANERCATERQHQINNWFRPTAKVVPINRKESEVA